MIKNHIIPLLSFCFLCLMGPIALAQTSSRPLTVEQAVQMGLEHSNRLTMAEAGARESQAFYREVRSGRFPVLQAQASYMRLSDNIPSVDFTIPGTDSTFTVLPVELNQFHSDVSLEQPLFTGGRLNRQIEAANHRANAAELMAEQEQADAAFEIRKAYWGLFEAESMLKTTETAIGQIDEHLRDVSNRVDEGTALQSDLLRVRSRRAEILLEKAEANNRFQLARLELSRLLGLPAGTEIHLTEENQPGSLPYETGQLTDAVLQQRPDLHALSEQVKAYEKELSIAENNWLPELMLVGRYVYARPNQYFFAEQDQFRGTWEAGLALRWKIWAGGQRSHQTGQALARLQHAEAELAEYQAQMEMNASMHYLNLEYSLEAIDVSLENIEAAREAFRTVQNQFEEGVALSSEVLDVEYEARMAQARYAAAIANYETAKASVLQMLGLVWGANDERR